MAERQQPGQVGQPPRVRGQPGAGAQHHLAVRPHQVRRLGAVRRAVGAQQRGQVPVGARGEHGGHVAEAGQVEPLRRGEQHVGVGDQPVRPAGRRGPLDPGPQQHGERVGVAVDARGGLHRDQRRAGAGGGLADIGDRAGPDGDHAAGAGGRAGRGGDRLLVGVHRSVGRAELNPFHGVTGRDPFLDRLAQSRSAHRHGRGRGEHDHVAGSGAEPGQHVAQPVERAGPDGQPGHAQRLERLGRVGQRAAQSGQVERHSVRRSPPGPHPPRHSPFTAPPSLVARPSLLTPGAPTRLPFPLHLRLAHVSAPSVPS